MTKRSDDDGSLFDEIGEDEPLVQVHEPVLERRHEDPRVQTARPGSIPGAAPTAWHEAPAALFLSWSRRQQLAYCAARDEDGAATNPDVMGAAWFLARAAAYRLQMEELS